MWRSPLDVAPHRRRLAWNADGTLLAACSSGGIVHLIDSHARVLQELCHTVRGHIEMVHSQIARLSGADRGCNPAVVDIVWRTPTDSLSLCSELLVLGADATLRRFVIQWTGAACSPLTISHEANVCFDDCHTLVTSLAYDGCNDLLAIGGASLSWSPQARLLLAKMSLDVKASSSPPSLSLWSLSDVPKDAKLLFTSTSANSRGTGHAPGYGIMPATWHPSLPQLLRPFRQQDVRNLQRDLPTFMTFSSDGSRLAVLTTRGKLSVWRTASICDYVHRGCSLGNTDETRTDIDVGTAAYGMLVREPPMTFCNAACGSEECWASIHWWDADALVLVTRSGALCVCALPSMTNLLGAQPEQFARQLCICAACTGRIFVLERQLQAGLPYQSTSLITSTLRRFPPLLDRRKFAPTRAKDRRRRLSWRLISLLQTSPEQLFLRKASSLRNLFLSDMVLHSHACNEVSCGRLH